MPVSIVFAWRTVAFAVGMILALLILERLSSRKLPRALWRIAWCQAILVTISSCIELLPYYLYGKLLPGLLRYYKNWASMFALLVFLLLYVRLGWMMRRRNTE